MTKIDGVNPNNEFQYTLLTPRSQTQINSIWSARATNSVKDIKEVSDTHSNKNVDSMDSLDTSIVHKAMQKLLELSINKEFFKNCKQLKDSMIPQFSSLPNIFENKQRSLVKEAESLTGNLETLKSSDLASIAAKIDAITQKVTSLHNQLAKTVDIDCKLNDFAAKGGDLSKIDIDKLNYDILEAIDDSDSSSGKVGENATPTTEACSDTKDDSIDEFLTLLKNSDPKEIADSDNEYIKKDKNNKDSASGNDSQNFSNPFAMKKNPFNFM